MAPVPVQKAQLSAERTASGFTRWIEENRTLAISLALGTLAVGGAGAYYLYSNPSSSSSGDRTKDRDVEKGDDKSAGSSAAKKKKGKKGKKGKESPSEAPAKDASGPLLDEASDGEQTHKDFPGVDLSR